jgi:dolichol-phosphate mannosyltransferase
MKAMIMLPTYNERDNIETLVSQILKQGDVSVVIVDDSSPDGTGELADKLAMQNPDIIHVIHRQERGRGTAGIAGFRYALGQDVDCIIEMDADFSHHPKYIPQFLEKVKDYDIVIGSRFIKGGKSIRTPMRGIISRSANMYTRLLLGGQIREWVGGYKCYSKVALSSLDFNSFYSKGYSIGMETLYRLLNNGFSYVEIPIEFKDKRKGSKFSAHEIISYMITVVRLKLRL